MANAGLQPTLFARALKFCHTVLQEQSIHGPTHNNTVHEQELVERQLAQSPYLHSHLQGHA